MAYPLGKMIILHRDYSRGRATKAGLPVSSPLGKVIILRWDYSRAALLWIYMDSKILAAICVEINVEMCVIC